MKHPLMDVMKACRADLASLLGHVDRVFHEGDTCRTTPRGRKLLIVTLGTGSTDLSSLRGHIDRVFYEGGTFRATLRRRHL